MSTLALDHVAVLVHSLEGAAETFKERSIEFGPIEEFPSEGTRELYLGHAGQDGKLLLLEATGPGPYQSALNRRGPGLHHIALRSPDPVTYAATLQGSGWYLLPTSLASYRESGTVWLGRAGTPILIEVMNSPVASADDALVTEIELPINTALIEALLCPQIKASEQCHVRLGDWSFEPTEVSQRRSNAD